MDQPKVSFSVAKSAKAQTQRKTEPAETPDYVTRIQNNQLQSKEPKQRVKEEKVVIPLAPNTFGKPAHDDEANPTSNNQQSNIKQEPNDDQPLDINDDKALSEKILKNLSSGAVPSYLQVRKREEQDDVFTRQAKRSKPNDDENSMSIPINEFGKALLRGMGWEEGKAYGRSDKVIEPFIMQQRPRLAGIGSSLNPNEPVEEEGKGDALETLWMDKTTKNLVQNAIVNVVDGPYDGLVGQILDHDADRKGKRNVKLNLPNRLKTLIAEEHLRPIPNTLKELDVEHEVRKFARSVNVFSVKEDAKQEDHHHEEEDHDRKPKRITWVVPNIRVRIISKSYGRGRYYNEKVVVEDVPDAYYCVARYEGKVLDKLEERHIETIIPRETGTPVVCVAGRNRGKRGVMVDKDRKKQVVSVQVTDEDEEDYGQIYTIHYDDVCEFVPRR
jgi:hypothetical protein